MYQTENVDDLQRFFDRYLKDVSNGWEDTPQIRLSLLGYNRPSVVNRPVEAYPPSDFKLETFFLDAASGRMSSQMNGNSSVSYETAARRGPGCSFVHQFDKYTELCGFSRVKLFMSCEDHDDLDVYVVLRKLDKLGTLLEHINIPLSKVDPAAKPEDVPHVNVFKYIGPNGRLRASHRKVLPEEGLSEEKQRLLSETYVWHSHKAEEKVVPGEVVEMEMSLWPGGMIFDAGEAMQLVVMGSLPILPEHPGLDDKMANYNVGRHTLHTGERRPSTFQAYLSHQ